MIFVFGSNLAGRHGKGAALTAKREHGAIQGQGIGRQGNSYAIPTKDRNLKTLPLYVISGYVGDFLEYARANPDLEFLVTPIGTGLAGYKHEQIAPLFLGAPENCHLPAEWAVILAEIEFCQVFYLSDEAAQALEKALEEPPKPKPRLKALMQSKAPWEENL